MQKFNKYIGFNPVAMDFASRELSHKSRLIRVAPHLSSSDSACPTVLRAWLCHWNAMFFKVYFNNVLVQSGVDQGPPTSPKKQCAKGGWNMSTSPRESCRSYAGCFRPPPHQKILDPPLGPMYFTISLDVIIMFLFQRLSCVME